MYDFGKPDPNIDDSKLKQTPILSKLRLEYGLVNYSYDFVADIKFLSCHLRYSQIGTRPSPQNLFQRLHRSIQPRPTIDEAQLDSGRWPIMMRILHYWGAMHLSPTKGLMTKKSNRYRAVTLRYMRDYRK